MKYIIGLGNPGEKYIKTRHNFAWIVFGFLGLDEWKYDKYMNAEFVGESVSDELVLYIKPQTFMNKSGEIIATLKRESDFSHNNVILIYDDVDLAFGQIRISHNRGDGGHNGVKSITQHLGTQEITRIRLGISRKLDDGRLIKPNVLSAFDASELKEIEKVITPKVKQIIESLLTNGLEKTMNNFNVK